MMWTVSEGRAALVIARTEVTRTLRRLRASRRRVLYGTLGVLIYAAIAGVVTFVYSRVVLAGDGPPEVATARAFGLSVVALTTLLVAYRTVKQAGVLEASEHLLTATTPRAAAVGVITAEYVQVLLFHGLWLLAFVTGFGLGVADLTATGVLTVVVLGVVAFVITAGFAAGMAVKYVFMRSSFLVRHRDTLGITLSCLVVGGSAIALHLGSLDHLPWESFLALPPAWLADLALVGMSTVRPTAVHFLGAAGLLVIGTPLLGAVGTRLAALVWTENRMQLADSPATERTGATRIEWPLADRAPTPTRQVALRTWLRARRSPARISDGLSPYLVPAMLVALAVAFDGQLPSWTMYGFAGASVVVTGTMFALNPIGDEESVMPVTLTSGVDPRAFLAGLVVVSWAVGLPLTVVVTVSTGLATGVNPVIIAGATLLAGSFSLGVPGIALAAGTAFPSFGTTSLPGDREIVEPSLLALVAMVIVLALAALPLLLVAASGSDDWAIIGASGLLSVALGSLSGWAGFRYAVTQFGRYTPSPKHL